MQGRFVVVGETAVHIVGGSRACWSSACSRPAAPPRRYPWLGDDALVKLRRTVARLRGRYTVATAEVGARPSTSLGSDPERARNQVPADAEELLDIHFPAGDADLSRKPVADVTAACRACANAGSRRWWTSSTRAPRRGGSSRG